VSERIAALRVGAVLVIFDCDGVLVDSEWLSNLALTEALADVGIIMSVEESMAEFMGRDRRHMLARVAEMLGGVGGDVLDGFGADYDTRRDDAFRRELAPVAGIETALDALAERGIPTCVASSADHPKLRLTLGLTGLIERFEGRIYSAFDVERGKPAPDLFLHAAAQMGFEPGDCVVVEDAAAGVEAARAARMRVLGYNVEADVTFTDMRALPDLL
jgi:HAD superfamily hydrolase (TIGR01509 family)